MDPAHQLQSAARKFAKHIAPSAVVDRVVLHGPHGKVATLPVPFADEPVIEPAAVAKAGWDFTGPVPRFDGTLVPIHGRKADLLRVLVESGRPRTVDELRPAWEGSIVEETSIRWQVAELRKALKLLFPGLEEPILTTPEGYSLQIR